MVTSTARKAPDGVSQRNVYEAVEAFIVVNGYSPTVREIGGRLGLSAAVVHFHIGNLIAQGLLTHEPRSPRTLRPC
jgi:predicted ArsR family transcriptional regulator